MNSQPLTFGYLRSRASGLPRAIDCGECRTSSSSGPSSCIWGSCDKERLLRKRFRDRSWQAQIGSQHIGRIRGYPRAEVVGMIVPIVEPDQQAQNAATDVADVVAGAHRHVTDVTRHELFGYYVTHPQINSHLSRTLKIVLPLIGVGMPVKLTHGARLDLQ